jgi:hypothetical protein
MFVSKGSLVSLVLLSAVGGALACSSSSNPDQTKSEGGVSANKVTATGTYEGKTLDAPVGLAFSTTASASGTFGFDASSETGQLIEVVIIDTAAATCSALQSNPNSEFSNSSGIGLFVGADTGKVLPGTYMLNAGVQAQYTVSNSSCGDAGGVPTATAGSVTVTNISGTSISGTYDVTFGSKGAMTGTFDLPFCDTPSPSGSKTCVQ